MDMVTRVVVEERRPREPGEKPRLFGQKHDPDLLLVIYDTAVIERINNERDAEPGMERFKMKMPPGKYALSFEEGSTDSGIFGQVMLTNDEYRDIAVWFDRFTDLPFAIKALQERHPDVKIPDQVSYAIDWPVNREDFTAGATVVVTKTGQVLKPAA